jgi:hypothetical protein
VIRGASGGGFDFPTSGAAVAGGLWRFSSDGAVLEGGTCLNLRYPGERFAALSDAGEFELLMREITEDE